MFVVVLVVPVPPVVAVDPVPPVVAVDPVPPVVAVVPVPPVVAVVPVPPVVAVDPVPPVVVVVPVPPVVAVDPVPPVVVVVPVLVSIFFGALGLLVSPLPLPPPHPTKQAATTIEPLTVLTVSLKFSICTHLSCLTLLFLSTFYQYSIIVNIVLIVFNCKNHFLLKILR